MNFKLKQSGLFSINTLDLLKGLIVTAIAGVLYNAEILLVNYHIDPTIKIILSYIAAYLLKNFFTPGPKSEITVEVKPEIQADAPEDIGLPKPRQ